MQNWLNGPIFRLYKKLITFPCVVWSEESKSGLGFEVEPSYGNVPTRSHPASSAQTQTLKGVFMFGSAAKIVAEKRAHYLHCKNYQTTKNLLQNKQKLGRRQATVPNLENSRLTLRRHKDPTTGVQLHTMKHRDTGPGPRKNTPYERRDQELKQRRVS